MDLDQIDPVFYRATYYLAPEGEAADKAYALLREVMRKANKVAIGTVVMRNKEYTVAIRPDDEVLKLETMYFADEIRSPSRELPSLPSTGAITEREVQMAGLLLESMESDWEPEKYRDTHREKVEALIESKRQGNEIVTGAEAAPPSTKVVDLMEVLSASLELIQVSLLLRPPSKQAAPAPRATRARSTATPTATAGKKGVAARKAAAPKGTAKRPTPIKGTAKRPTPIKGTAKATKPKTAARRKAS